MNLINPLECPLYTIPSCNSYSSNEPYKKTAQFIEDIIVNRGCVSAVCYGGGYSTHMYFLRDYGDKFEWWESIYDDKSGTGCTKSKNHEQNTERKILFC